MQKNTIKFKRSHLYGGFFLVDEIGPAARLTELEVVQLVGKVHPDLATELVAYDSFEIKFQNFELTTSTKQQEKTNSLTDES